MSGPLPGAHVQLRIGDTSDARRQRRGVMMSYVLPGPEAVLDLPPQEARAAVRRQILAAEHDRDWRVVLFCTAARIGAVLAAAPCTGGPRSGCTCW